MNERSFALVTSSVTSAIKPPQRRLSSPTAGRTLGGAVTATERPVRLAIANLGRAVEVDKSICTQIFGSTQYGPGAHIETFDVRLAWFMVTTALIHAWKTGNSTTSSFSAVLLWFTGDQELVERILACYPSSSLQAAEIALTELEITGDFWDLLPYVLEPHGHITRSELESSEIARETRSAKKSAGVYYTPSDVADFMVACVSNPIDFSGKWLDPACGSGVFLRAIVRHFKANFSNIKNCTLNFISNNLYAIDKSALATDLASFVLLGEIPISSSNFRLPIFEWQLIKRKIICMDSLRISSQSYTGDILTDKSDFVTISKLFPTNIGGTFDHLVMNPPYAKVRIDQHIKANWESYAGVALGALADTHLGFTEMLWKFVRQESKAVAVLPLSIGTNTTKAFKALRESLLASSGEKEFLFFDREPQALFGEDIKTRNVVIIRQSGHLVQKSLKTSRMLKWTAPQRPNIFTCNRSVLIDNNLCQSFIPKIGTRNEVNLYKNLQSNNVKLKASQFKPILKRLAIEDALSNCQNKNTVLLSATAYNFINCFYCEALPKIEMDKFSKSPINALIFSSASDACAAFAILSSRLCFWLWHVEGDGFHLTSDFLQRLPMWGVVQDEVIHRKLAILGSQLWIEAKNHTVRSVNSGKQTFSFHAGHEHPLTLEVDQLLIEALQLGSESHCLLSDFVKSTVSIDGKYRGRGINNLTKEYS